MAAGQAALAGADVLVLEKMNQAGKKLLLTGQGRCNITNVSERHDFIAHFNRAGRFLHQPFARFFVAELMFFFQQQGLSLTTERGGRVFPTSNRAADVVATLLRWLADTGARLQCASAVCDLVLDGDRVAGVRCADATLTAEAVIIATGGASYPATGSTGDGFTFARRAGHTIVSLQPALIGLTTADSRLTSLARLDLRNVGVRIYLDGKRKKTAFGEVGFTRSGLGGPVILTHSREIVSWLRQSRPVTVALDLKPALDHAKLDARLQRDFTRRTKEELRSVLGGLLPRQLIPVCLDLLALDGSRPAGAMTAAERTRLRNWLKDFRIEISGFRPLREAIVTAGGVRVAEVNPQTMESRLVKGLYFAGELLDIDGDTGGYNLQAAFSTGWLAGCTAAGTGR